jgi:cyclin B
MKNQRDINEKMRGILIDWLVDVHLKFKLLPETLFLSTELIDRYLEKVEINRNKLQLVGVSSLFIACKYEEIYPPELKDFVYITDKAYSKEEILKMEYEILRSLDFNITSPSSLRLLEAYIEIFQLKWEDQQLFFAKYLLELFLVDYRMIKYSPSWIAASTIYITMKVKKFNTIDGTKTIDMPKVTGYTDEKIKECARDICIVLDNAERSSLQAVRNKYSSSKFLEVAKWKKN